MIDFHRQLLPSIDIGLNTTLPLGTEISANDGMTDKADELHKLPKVSPVTN